LNEVLSLKNLTPNGDKIWTLLKEKPNGNISEIRQKLIQRDLKIIFIDDTIKNFDIKDILIGEVSKKEYSPPAIWAILKDIPSFVKTEKIFKDDKLDSLNLDDIPLHLYDLYTSYRM
jgi:hypothetical protein